MEVVGRWCRDGRVIRGRMEAAVENRGEMEGEKKKSKGKPLIRPVQARQTDVWGCRCERAVCLVVSMLQKGCFLSLSSFFFFLPTMYTTLQQVPNTGTNDCMCPTGRSAPAMLRPADGGSAATLV